MHFWPSQVKRLLHITSGMLSADPKTFHFSEAMLAAFLVYRGCHGDTRATSCPLALYLKQMGVPAPRVFTDRITFGITWPFGPRSRRPYLLRWTLPLTPRLKQFQSNAFLYPILFDPHTPHTLKHRLEFVLSALGTNLESAKRTSEMIIEAIRKGEVQPGGDLELSIDPKRFDKASVENLLQSLRDTPPAIGPDPK